jgi:hypothetical protein
MEITIESLIAGLTKNYALTDRIVVTWWSKDDVNLLLDETVSDSRAEELWDEVSETFANDLDSVICIPPIPKRFGCCNPVIFSSP